MVQRLGAAACGTHEDLKLLADLHLADVVIDALGAQSAFHGFFIGAGGRG